MSKLRIFIEGKELDSLDSVTVPITKQFEELSDPTVICNDYSKTVTVPLSKNNNEIFGHCYNPDRLIVAGSEDTPLVGIYFDPYKKLDCRLQWGDDVFFTGYAKMLKVTNKGYEVTINGELGKVFQELQKITFDKTKYEDEEDIAKYWIDGSVYLDATMNADFVKSCWSVYMPSTTLYKVGDSNYKAGNLISFVLNPYRSSNYEGSKHISQYAVTEAVENSKWCEAVTYNNKTYTPTLAKFSAVLDDMAPYQLRQYRSYQQFPVMYFNQFWQIFKTKAEEVTGYKWETSGKVFGSYFFVRSVFALKNYENIVKDVNSQEDSTFYYTIGLSHAQQREPDKYASDGTVLVKNASGADILNPKYNLMRFTLSDSYMEIRSYNYSSTALNRSTLYYGGSSNYAYIALSVCGKRKIVWVNSAAVADAVQRFTNVVVIGVEDQSNMPMWVDLRLPYNNTAIAVFPKDGYDDEYSGNRLSFRFSSGWVGEQKYAQAIVGVKSDGSIFTSNLYRGESTIIGTGSNSCYENSFNSGVEVTLNTFLSKGWDLILEWCKAFRVQITADNLNKVLKFQGSDDYFASPTVTDMTERVDTSTFEVDLLRTDKKKFVFGQANENSNTSQVYEDSYGVGYGCIKFDTGYNFGSDEQQVVTLRTPLIKQLSTYLVSDLFAGKLTYDLQAPTLSVEDDEGKYAGLDEGTFFYLRFASNKGIALTDDSEFELGEDKVYPYVNDTYTAVASGAEIYYTIPNTITLDTTVYPVASPFYVNNIGIPLMQFGIPAMQYVSSSSAVPQSGNNIFSDYWKKYLNERYNVQNKKVTTYVRLSPSDFIGFNFSQLWKIGNQVYIVNKIYDYDITSDKPTKVDLITIQDINAYK